MQADDLHFMAQALAVGRRGMGHTGENPSVGCVIVKDGTVVGLGHTQPGGRPHAEAQALAMAGANSQGATAYVTLEPCSHYGKTPPCADALIAAGISRAVIAIQDPDPRVSGSGIERLREAGIEVTTGILAQEARRDLAGFLTRTVKNRPHVTLKLALSADGMMAAVPGARTLITGAAANARTHLMRARSDAIMVGIGTVLADDPELTCRLPGLEHRSPIRIVADARLALPLTSKLLTTAAQLPVWLLTLGGTPPDEPGMTAIQCRATPEGRLDFTDALGKLAARGVGRLMVEGGARVASDLLAKGLVDELFIFTSPKPLGPGGLKPEISLAAFRLAREEMLGDDRLTVYEAHR
jgi:diaminohydroxyphosphoribosylaminopyrimidine deaminase / 5-amino-6-(5-phosphoribosylamino)uracil reductase